MAKLVVTGLKAIDRKLAQLEPKVAKRHVRTAVREGAKVFQSELKAKAPAGETGRLAAAPKVRAGKGRRGAIRADALIDVQDLGGKPYHAATEYGTSEQAPQGYARRAFDARGDYVRRYVVAGIRQGIEREARG